MSFSPKSIQPYLRSGSGRRQQQFDISPNFEAVSPPIAASLCLPLSLISQLHFSASLSLISKLFWFNGGQRN
ncbi:hypothetical protein RchiOBHm_Chr5g0034521 [Rosa chinensis]|uniref:Uncharacterized protein n=1 Tax=Rosa chinensis TaxID=74649 RepID=A0A2P6QB02_ROSCH|nr:hypothetical protein RchiOBHm_Chr5g0034521 [Rosa chinensis]